MQAVVAALGQEQQQLAQFPAPGAHGPEQRQGFRQRQPVPASPQQLGEEHRP